MPVFSKILSDKEILSFVTQDDQSILLVGCAWCVNESLAYTLRQPIFKREHEFDFIENGKFAFSTQQELLRIKGMISNKCQRISLLGPMELEGKAICALEKEDIEKIISTIQNNRVDKVLVLSCASGVMLLKNVLSVPSIGITSTYGYLSYAYTDDKTERRIDYKHSKIIK